jgi:C-terminal processing protease CtpA/Prc
VSVETAAVVTVTPTSQARAAGVRVGDIVVGVNGEPVAPTLLVAALRAAGRPCTLNLRRPPLGAADAPALE